MDDTYELIADIYEASVVPEQWRTVLHRIGEMSGASGAILLTAGRQNLQWIASPGAHDDFLAYLEERWHVRNTRQARLMAAQHAGFLRDIDIYPTPEAVQEEPQVREFFRPRGLGWGMGTVIPVPSGDFLIF